MTPTDDGGGTSLWGGRFKAKPSALLRNLNDSFSIDQHLATEDIDGSIAWTLALQTAGAISSVDGETLRDGLGRIRAELDAGAHLPIDRYEDVHSWVESRLGEIVGPVAGKLHTGRSRNDQVATDLRLWLLAALDEAKFTTLDLATALASRAESEHATPMPGYTHLKRAEPVTFGHWCLAYVEMLLRDAARFTDARERADECPLGSGALSGSPIAVDRETLSHNLGFARPSANSLDAVSDRDAAAEYLFASAMLFSHLSRMAEDLIVYSSDETGFVELPDALATGSSRMPHKKNPDILELARGHAGRAIGDLTGLLAMLKGLPLAYDKDLQLDKEPLFRMRSTISTVLPALTALMEELVLHRDRMATAASSDLLLATEIADALAERGVPFRKAHEIVGRRVAASIESGKRIRELGPDDEINVTDLEALDVGRALDRRRALGGTAPARVKSAAVEAIQRIHRLRASRVMSDMSDKSGKSDPSDAKHHETRIK